jgi:hypothetical protein
MFKRSSVIAGVGLCLLAFMLPAAAQSLGAASSFAVVGAAGVTAAGGGVISGDVGSSPSSSITGFPPASVTPPWGIHANDAAAIAARAASIALFTSLSSGACADTPGAQMGGVNFGPGIHCFASSANLAASTNVTLTGPGVFIFRVPSALTANVLSTMTLVNVDPCSVFWQVGTAATLNGVNFAGTVVTQAGVTLGVNAGLTGRALATVGPVTMAGANSVGGCSAVAPLPPAPLPTLTKSFNPVSIVAGNISMLTITLLNPDTTAATLTAALVDALPTGVTIAGSPNASTTCAGGVVTAVASATTVALSAGSVIPAGVGSAAGACTVTVNVTGNLPGSYLNVIPAGALQTGNGNNAAPVEATLTIVPLVPVPPTVLPPTIAKSFTPTAIVAGGVSQLTIVLSNPNTSVATLTATFTDNLPSGVFVAVVPNASTTCTGSGNVVAIAGSTAVTLPATRSIPAGVGTTPGSCTVSVDVTAPLSGNYINTIPASALQTSNGANGGPAVATLAVTAVIPPLPPVPPGPPVPPPPYSEIPTLSEWAMLVMTLLIALTAFWSMRRRRA